MMRKNSLFLFLGFLAALGMAACGGVGMSEALRQPETSSAPPPKWYTKLEAKMGRVVGYGQGSMREHAKNQALADIAQQLQVQVKSTIKSSVDVVDASVTRAESTKFELTAHQQLQNTRVVAEEAAGGITFIAIEFDARPAEQIVADRLLTEWGGIRPPRIDWKGHHWLANTDFVNNVRQQITINSGGTGAREVRIALNRRNDEWHISFDNVVMPIENTDLLRLIGLETTNPNNRLVVMDFKSAQEKNRLVAGDAFYLTLQTTRPDGYYTLFNIYDDGRLALLQESKKTEAIQTVPSLENRQKGYSLVAQTLKPKETAIDVYLSVLSSEPLDTSVFEAVSGQQVGNAFHLDTLLDMLDHKTITDIAVVRVNIRP